MPFVTLPGSEIYKDVGKCIEEIEGVVENEMEAMMVQKEIITGRPS